MPGNNSGTEGRLDDVDVEAGGGGRMELWADAGQPTCRASPEKEDRPCRCSPKFVSIKVQLTSARYALAHILPSYDPTL